MEPFVRSDATEHLHLIEWEEKFPGLVAGFTLRTSGMSQIPYASCNLGLHVGDNPITVVANRQKLANRLGFDFEAWSSAEQVHGNLVQFLDHEGRGAGREQQEEAIRGTDGIYTDAADILLTSFYADCVPLFFLDPVHQVVGLAHAGWKGTVGLIATEMIEAFQRQFNSNHHEILVAIGPSIGGSCYEVDEQVMKHVRDRVPDWQACAVPTEGNRYMLDLPACNENILVQAGILPNQIVRTSWCTHCRTDLFFSHRKEAGKTGRMASFIGWKKDRS